MATTQHSEDKSLQNTTMDYQQENLSTEVIKDRLKRSYDIIAPAYNSWTIPNSAQRMHYLEKLVRLLPQLSTAAVDDAKNNSSSSLVKILELGCGCGVPVTQRLLSFSNVHVVANDISSTQIQLAREALLEPNLNDNDNNNSASQDATRTTATVPRNTKHRLTFLEGDMLALSPTPLSSSLDAVLGLYSIFHLPRDEQPTMLAKIHDWLKPGGLFLGNFAEDEAEAVVFDKWLHEDGWMFYSGWGAEETLEMVRKAGFEVLVGEVEEDSVRARFLWVLARKI